MNRVYQVYKGLQDAGRDILLPAPPLASHDGQEGGHIPNHGHGQIDRPDPHKVEDRIKLLANIEMDEDLIRLREKQIKEQQKQVLPKPNIDNNNAIKQGNLLKGIDSKTVRKVGIRAYLKSFYLCSLLSNTFFNKETK